MSWRFFSFFDLAGCRYRCFALLVSCSMCSLLLVSVIGTASYRDGTVVLPGRMWARSLPPVPLRGPSDVGDAPDKGREGRTSYLMVHKYWVHSSEFWVSGRCLLVDCVSVAPSTLPRMKPHTHQGARRTFPGRRRSLDPLRSPPMKCRWFPVGAHHRDLVVNAAKDKIRTPLHNIRTLSQGETNNTSHGNSPNSQVCTYLL